MMMRPAEQSAMSAFSENRAATGTCVPSEVKNSGMRKRRLMGAMYSSRLRPPCRTRLEKSPRKNAVFGPESPNRSPTAQTASTRRATKCRRQRVVLSSTACSSLVTCTAVRLQA